MLTSFCDGLKINTRQVFLICFATRKISFANQKKIFLIFPECYETRLNVKLGTVRWLSIQVYFRYGTSVVSESYLI